MVQMISLFHQISSCIRRDFVVGGSLVLVYGLQACQMDAPQEGVSDAQLCTYRASSRVESILSGMTLEDKVGEMTQLTLDMLCVGENHRAEEPHRLDSVRLDSLCISIGSVLNAVTTRRPMA